MHSPSYRWSCHGCGVVNDAGLASCSACGLAASATGKQIANAKSKASERPVQAASTGQPHWLLSGGSLTLLFPEGIAAALLFFASPGWLLTLLYSGQLLASAALSIGMAIVGAIGYFGFRQRSSGLLYVSVMLSLVVALWVNSLSQQHV